MKKTLIALAVIAASGSAWADSSVVLTGKLGVGVGSFTNAVQNGASPAASGTVNRFVNGPHDSSRFTLLGTEDLGDGNKALFQLESELDTSNGNGAAATSSYAGRLFNREAKVGLQGDWGKLMAGRMTDGLYQLAGDFDGRNNWNTGGIAVWAPWGSSNQKYRLDNAVRYDSPALGGVFVIDASYSLGGNAGNNSAGRVYDIGGRLNLGAFKAGVSVLNRNYDATPSVATWPKNGSKANVLAASYKFDPVTVFAGWSNSHDFGANGADVNKWDFMWEGAQYNLSAADLITFGAYQKKDKFNASTADHGANAYALGFQHSLSKRTMVFADFATAHNKVKGVETVYNTTFSSMSDLAPVAGATQNGLVFGMQHNF